jgi:hypothetical protein
VVRQDGSCSSIWRQVNKARTIAVANIIKMTLDKCAYVKFQKCCKVTAVINLRSRLMVTVD